MKKICLFAIFLIMLTFSTVFAENNEINLTGTTSVYVGDVVKWTADQPVTWTSGYPAVASVDKSGNITAHRAGSAHISATTASGAKKTVTLTVYNRPGKPEIKLVGKTIIDIGEKTTWKSTVSLSTSSVTWTSGYPAVASVDQHGNITGHKTGQAHITASLPDGTKKTVTMNVTSNHAVTGVQLTGKTVVDVGEKTTWKASVLPQSAYNKWVHWQSGYPAVASVDQQGNITTHRAGKANITVTATNGVKKTVAITVNAPYPSELNLAGKTVVTVGDKTTWKVSFTPAEVSNKWLYWQSGYPAVASVDQYGNITAHRAGRANITVTTANGIKKTVLIYVNERYPSSLSLAGKTSAFVGDTLTWKASVSPSSATESSVRWTSSNTAVASVDDNGKITALKAGKTQITATTANGIKKTVVFTVYNNNASVKLTPVLQQDSKTTFYYHKSRSTTVGLRPCVLPHISVSPFGTKLFMAFEYSGGSYIFFDTLTLNIDGITSKINVDYFDVCRGLYSLNCIEYINIDFSSAQYISLLNSIASSKTATITFSGVSSYSHTVSTTDKQAIKDILAAYAEMKG